MTPALKSKVEELARAHGVRLPEDHDERALREPAAEIAVGRYRGDGESNPAASGRSTSEEDRGS